MIRSWVNFAQGRGFPRRQSLASILVATESFSTLKAGFFPAHLGPARGLATSESSDRRQKPLLILPDMSVPTGNRTRLESGQTGASDQVGIVSWDFDLGLP